MAPGPEDPAEESIADLFHQLVDDGGNLVRAEANFYKQIALHRASKARNGLIALVAGGLMMFAAVIVLLTMIALGLATRIGPIGAGFVVTAVTAAGGGLLIRWGAVRVRALGGDEEEKTAIRQAGERP